MITFIRNIYRVQEAYKQLLKEEVFKIDLEYLDKCLKFGDKSF